MSTYLNPPFFGFTDVFPDLVSLYQSFHQNVFEELFAPSVAAPRGFSEAGLLQLNAQDHHILLNFKEGIISGYLNTARALKSQSHFAYLLSKAT
jgi:hypothetical protein